MLGNKPNSLTNFKFSIMAVQQPAPKGAKKKITGLTPGMLAQIKSLSKSDNQFHRSQASNLMDIHEIPKYLIDETRLEDFKHLTPARV